MSTISSILSLSAIALLLTSCGTKGPPPDVDADFEARFEAGELQLRPIEERGGGRIARSARPFVRAHPAPPEAPPRLMAAPEAILEAVVLDPREDGVEFHVFSIGQADSMLVIGPPPGRRTLLFDLGETGWNSRRNCLDVRDEIVFLTGRAHVDYLVVSHFHTDHAGYPRTEQVRNGRTRIQEGGGIFCLLDTVPAFFTVGTLIDRGDQELQFKPDRQQIHEAIIQSTPTWIANGTLGSRVAADFTPGLIDLGPGISVEVLATAGRVSAADPGALAAAEQQSPGTYRPDRQASPNDFSIGLEFTIGDFELLTAGDLTGAPGDSPYAPFMVTPHRQIYTNVESHMVDHWQTLNREADVEVYVVNHHGSANSSTTDLAGVIEPEVVIYSSGGRYHHPNRGIADRFLELGADQMVTTSVDDAEWTGGIFPEEYGNGWQNPVGDILVFVPLTGSFYTVATASQVFEYPILDDATEAVD